MVKVTYSSWIGLLLLVVLLLSQVPRHVALLLPRRVPVNHPAASGQWFRSRSSLGMGADWYNFKAIYSSDDAIMVTNKDIQETYRQWSTEEDGSIGDGDVEGDEDEEHDEDEEEDEEFYAPLDEEEVEWLLDRAPEFNAYEIGKSFVLFTKGPNVLREAPCLFVIGPYEVEDEFWVVRFNLEEAPLGELYTELFELARKFTPPGNKLSFPPGKYSLATTDEYMLTVKALKKRPDSSPDNSSSDDIYKEKSPADDDMDAQATVPFDFDLIVGNGDKKETIGVNRAVFLCCFPHIETMFGEALMDTKLELPELDPQAVQSVLDTYSSRKQARKPDSSERERMDFQNVQRAFGKSMIEMAKEETPNESSRLEHPAIADLRWLDASFLCGPQREEIKVNRLVLASMNPVLYRLLVGTDLIPVDPSKPIEWPDYDARAVRQVFLALLYCGKKEFVVPWESVASAKMLVDYLRETREALKLDYDTPFKREYQGKTVFRRGEDGYGLKFSYD